MKGYSSDTTLGYINESGYLNLPRFQAFLKAFAENDRHSFMHSMEDEQFLKQKRGQPGGKRLANVVLVCSIFRNVILRFVFHNIVS